MYVLGQIVSSQCVVSSASVAGLKKKAPGKRYCPCHPRKLSYIDRVKRFKKGEAEERITSLRSELKVAFFSFLDHSIYYCYVDHCDTFRVRQAWL